jgi:type VI secretion system secreted protein VgrG
MSPTLSQANRALRVSLPDPLKQDDMIVVAFEGEEAVSRPFRFTIELVSTKIALPLSAVLNKPMGLTIALPNGGVRQIHGIVRRFSHLGTRHEFTRWRAEIVPQFWFLTLSAACRTFENLSVTEIFEKVCKDAGVTNFDVRVLGHTDKLPYVVQYRESHFDFLSRLLEAEGLYYHFEHSADKHTLVVSNKSGGSIPQGSVASVKVGLGDPGAKPGIDSVTELALANEVHVGKWVGSDHQFLKQDSVETVQSDSLGATGTMGEFLGDLWIGNVYSAGSQELAREETRFEQYSGKSTAASFTAGTRVKLTGGLGGTAGTELHLLQVRHTAKETDLMSGGSDAFYENEFTAVKADRSYRPPLMTEPPSVRGTQSAKIVGTGGVGEIDVDADGRVLLEFPWDAGAGKGGKSKHRVHVASVWAGAGWGFVQHPRIGQEVLVEFLEGDPDRPIVTGRVYNSQNKYPYALPANKTQSGVKTRSVGGGDANFNELRFEDKKGSEQVYLHAEKDLRTHVESDEARYVGQDRATTIQRDDLKTVKTGNDWVRIEEGEHWTEVQKANYYIDVLEGEFIHYVKADYILTVDEGNRAVGVEKGDDTLTVADGNLTTNVKKKIRIDAGDEISLTCGQSSITMKKDGTITIKGKDITLDAMAKIVAKASGQVEIKGAKVTAEGQAQTEIKGAMLKLEGQAMTTLKGAIAQITGDGMLKAGGGISMFG